MTFNVPQNFVTDPYGFAPPTAGGAVACKYASVAYTDTTAKTLFTLPAGAVIVGWLVNVSTAFNSSGTDLLDIGNSGTANAYANDLNVASAGQINTGFVVSALFTELTEEVTVTATFVQSVADATTGAATIAVLYITL